MSAKRRSAAVALGMAALLGLNYPLLELAEGGLYAGVPSILWYLLLLWMLLIVGLYRLHHPQE